MGEVWHLTVTSVTAIAVYRAIGIKDTNIDYFLNPSMFGVFGTLAGGQL